MITRRDFGALAAAAAITGHLTDVRDIEGRA